MWKDNGSIFDARDVPPDQGGAFDKHPSGTFPFGIVDCGIKPTNEGDGNYFYVEVETPAGMQIARFNLWYKGDDQKKTQQTLKIAEGQFSALCHSVGVLDVDFKNGGKALMGARGMVEIGDQKKNDKYSEVKKWFDMNGNEPGKAPKASTQAGPFAGSQRTAEQAQQPQTQQQPEAAKTEWKPGDAAPATGADAKAPWSR